MKRIPIVVAALLVASTAPALAAMSDQEFVTAASVGGQYEFESGLFASTTFPDRRVQAVAAKIAEDHANINAELNVAAGREKLPVPFMMDETHDAMLRKLQTTQFQGTSAEAQRLYVSQQQTVHKQTIAMFEQYAKEGTNVRLKDFAQVSLPKLRNHMRAIDALAASR